jgi:hypothetical protein
VENAFARLKQYRAIATRYDKLKRNYESMVAIACGYLWPTYVKCQQTLAAGEKKRLVLAGVDREELRLLCRHLANPRNRFSEKNLLIYKKVQ